MNRIAIVAFAMATLFSASALAYTAVGPICSSAARVTATTYYRSGTYHGAIDIGNGTCSSSYMRGMLTVSKKYNFYGGCSNNCRNPSPYPNCNGGAGNYVKVIGANGYDFRQLHANKNGYSYSKYCTKCVLGYVGSTGHSFGAHVHVDNRRYGTRVTAWYKAYSYVGKSGNCSVVQGYPRLS